MKIITYFMIAEEDAVEVLFKGTICRKCSGNSSISIKETSSKGNRRLVSHAIFNPVVDEK